MTTREKVLNLKNEGKNLKEIMEILNLSKSTVFYHYDPKTKERVLSYTKAKREALKKGEKYKRIYQWKGTPFIPKETRNKFYKFRNGFTRRNLKYKTEKSSIELDAFLEKFNSFPFCYLTGDKLNLSQPDFSFDHIVPISKGGLNSLDNLGFTTHNINQMKGSLSLEEFVMLCKKVAKHFE